MPFLFLNNGWLLKSHSGSWLLIQGSVPKTLLLCKMILDLFLFNKFQFTHHSSSFPMKMYTSSSHFRGNCRQWLQMETKCQSAVVIADIIVGLYSCVFRNNQFSPSFCCPIEHCVKGTQSNLLGYVFRTLIYYLQICCYYYVIACRMFSLGCIKS